MTDTTNTTLTAKQESAIIALLDHPTLDAAANAVGISRKTITRWLKTSDFRSAFQAARRERFSVAAAKLSINSSAAIDVLQTMIDDPATPAYARVAAARAVIQLSHKLIEHEELLARITSLEHQLGLK